MSIGSTSKTKQNGSIELICGSMFSGKTEELIRRLKRARLARLQVEVFKPEVDNRYHPVDLVSHNEITLEATPIQHAGQLLLLATQAQVVGIDEAQFFDDSLVMVCNQLADQGIRVIVAGLDMDFKGQPFGPMPQLMAIANEVTKVHAICMHCGDLALYSYRIKPSEKLVELGTATDYIPLCRSCYLLNTSQSEQL